MLARASSFSRRSKRAPTDPAATKENYDNAPAASAKPTGVVGKIVRSASFSRRAKKNIDSNSATDEDATSSGSPDTDRLPKTPPSEAESAASSEAEPQSEGPPVLQEQLYGWLYKKSSSGSSGSHHRRYFYVDETRGTLAYAKSAKSNGKKPSAVLPIADITRITRDDNAPFQFVISCPPIHLTLTAPSAKDSKHWVDQLELRREIWTARQREKMPVADVASMMRQASEERSNAPPGAIAPRGAPPAEPPAGLHASSGLANGLPMDVTIPAGAGGEPIHDELSRDELVPRPAIPEMMPSPGRGQLAPPHPRTEVAGAGVAPIDLSAGEAPDLSAGEVAEASGEAPEALDEAPEVGAAAMDAPRRRGAMAAPTPQDEAVELYSDEESASPGIHSANKASGGRRSDGAARRAHSPPMRAPAPVPLASMMSSSDEEEEDDDAALPMARPKARAPGASVLDTLSPIAAAQAPAFARAPEENEAESTTDELPSMGDATTAMDAVPASAADWDSDEEAEMRASHRTYGAAGSQSASTRGADTYGDCVMAADAVETLDDARSAPSPPAPPEPPMVMAAPGIVADENFAEDDWDDDDM